MRSAEYTIRAAKPEDAPGILVMLGRLAAYEGAEQAPRLGQEALARDVFCAEPRLRIFVAAVDESGLLMGFVSAFQGYSSWAGGPTLHVGDLWVQEDWRGSGVGKKLMEHVLAEFPHARAEVWVVDGNSAARFYERMGFSAVKGWRTFRRERPHRTSGDAKAASGLTPRCAEAGA